MAVARDVELCVGALDVGAAILGIEKLDVV